MRSIQCWALFVVFVFSAGCSSGEAGGGDATEQEVSSATQAMSRCGYPPRRPWPAGCHYTCVCSEPVNAPFGEDIGDYHCFGDTCYLEPRADCAFELQC
jgi:hypothetical protein